MSQSYKQRPSEIIGITNKYDAFCFDEACIYILNQLKDEKEPIFEQNIQDNNKTTVEWMLKHSKPIN